jgi:3-oxoacyl-[acyl-carrier-protein] synthase II
MTRDVVITGRGVVSSLGESPEALFDALLAGRSGLSDGAGPCADFDPEAWVPPKEARRLDRCTQLAIAAALQAAAEAGLDAQAADPARVGVVIGTGIGGLETLQRECSNWLEGGDRAVSPHFVPMMMPNAAAGEIAIRLGAHGPGFCIASACASGAHALGESLRMLQRGEADVVVAVGCEAALVGLCLAAFRKMGALSREGVSRPFDARRDGFVMGEGAAVLVLEREDHARARGAAALGRLTGYGASNDAFHITQPEAEGHGAARAMTSALADAEAAPADVGYISAHGTSTPHNDRIEAHAIGRVFNGHAPPVSSQKSAVGHLLGAAGALEALVTLEAVRRQVLPPTINHEVPDPDIDLDVIPAGPREAPGLELALSNSFGFGGQNACLAVAAA